MRITNGLSIRLIATLLCSLALTAAAVVFTNDTVIPPGNTNYDGQELVISNCTVTVDGPHRFASVRVAPGGALTHTASATGTIPIYYSIVDEPQILAGTNAVLLAVSNAALSTVAVRDSSGTVTYSNTLDYALAAADGLTTLQRTETSAISDGSLVLVSYDFTNGTTRVGLNLTATGNFDVDAGGAINADGRGQSLGSAGGSSGSPLEGGGGSGGGDGGNSSNNAPGGHAFGQMFQPVEPGGSGGAGMGGPGGSGGGAIRLIVAGTLQVNGSLTASGINATNSRSGGGGGGSIWLSATNFTGNGSITANGGAGEPVRGGGGGGGHIVIDAGTSTFAGNVLARGGAGFVAGGAGVVYLHTNGLSGLLWLDNGGQSGASTPFSVFNSGDNLTLGGGAIGISSGTLQIGNLLLKTQSRMTAKPGLMMPLTLSVAGDATIQTGASISLDGLGYSSNGEPTAGGTYTTGLTTTGGGGGSGGYGGSGTNATARGGIANADPVNAPRSIGYGGGGRISSTNVGGAGGSTLTMTVGGTLQLDGSLSANGNPASYYGGGGGAGGSINLTAGALAGAGSISANGGAGIQNGGGGGGGRIAIHCATDQFTGTASAAGGAGTNWGGAGTIYRELTGQTPEIVLDNHGHAGAWTPMPLSGSNHVLVTGAAILMLSSSSQSFASLLISSNSFVSPTNFSSLTLTINGDAVIEAGGGIIGHQSTSGGTGGGNNGGGGGHGGYGGVSSNGVPGGYTYGSITAPITAGSGGGSSSSATGGRGGSAIRLEVAGTLTLDGILSVNGGNAYLSPLYPSPPALPAGGGSGGGLWITAGTLSGSGAISANGGAGFNSGGGGGGGRIAIYTSTNLFSGIVSAQGGSGYFNGGAGTIYTRLNSSAAGLVLVDNRGSPSFRTTATPVTVATNDDLTIYDGMVSLNSTRFRHLFIGSNAWVRDDYLSLDLAGNATIQSGGGIVADGLGSGPGSGAGAGSSYGTGGGYGGYGAGGSNGVSGGGVYGRTTNPTSQGSGGNPSSSSPPFGGSGGGLVRLTVAGTLTLDGKISANGTNGYSTTSTIPLGGGSGGGIALTAGTLAGSGLISANGGPGLYGGGGGGGGRIAINYETNLFTGTITASGNTGYRSSGAGTIYLKQTGADIGHLILDNLGIAGTNTPVGLTSGADDLTVRGNAIAYTTNAQSFRQLLIANNSTLTFSTGTQYSLTVTGDATIQSGGAILADRLGYPSNGLGYASATGTGAGHGGYGGGYSTYAAAYYGGIPYGSITEPNTIGSRGNAGGYGGGYGGGVVRLTVAGTMQLDGKISANGGNGIPQYPLGTAGGGAGGSIWLTAGTLSGSGTLSANGGAGHSVNGGGAGAGGRIAVYYGTNLFTGVMSACGNTGISTPYNTGGAGTIYTKANNSPAGLVMVDNGGALTRAETPISSSSLDDLVIRGNALVTATGTPGVRNLLVGTNGWLYDAGSGLNLTVSGDATVELGGQIYADGRAPVPGPGAGSYTSTPRGGGGHAGYGALNPPNSGGAYGSIQFPTNAGSIGGNGLGSAGYLSFGGHGGGVILLDVLRTLTIAGTVSASGTQGDSNSGGGSGGSVWLTAGTLAGTGIISANGGPGSGTGGGGAGGRISIGYATNDFSGTLSAHGGTGGQRGGAGTVYTKVAASPVGLVTVDNGGLTGTNTPIEFADPAAFSLLARNGGSVVFPVPMLIRSNLVVGSGGLITPLPGQTNLDLAVMGDLLISTGGAISLDGCGFAQGTGPGAGATLASQGGGAGHGGAGGDALSGAPGGTNYGSVMQPVERGSGGGSGSSSTIAGGSDGGGAVRLTVAGTLTLDGGTLSANGNDGLQDDSGGGAGGSIWVTAGKLMGNGSITAHGGWGDLYGGGGGAGGCIAIYTPSNYFMGGILATGGQGASPAQDGSIYISSFLPAFMVVSQSPSGTVSNGVSSVDLSFNTPLNPLTASASDVIVMTPQGVLPESDVSVYAPGPAMLRVTFPLQTAPGNYSLRVGPQLEDLLGTAMSQVYTGAFTVVLPVIQGTVTDTNSQPVAGVTMLPSSGSAATTDASGHYTLGFVPGTSLTVTPSFGNLMFAPGTRTYTNLTESLTGENYVAVATIAPTVSGGGSGTNLWLNWHGLTGVTYQAWWSTNLADWLPYGDPITGTNGTMNLLIPMDADPQKFYRLGAVN